MANVDKLKSSSLDPTFRNYKAEDAAKYAAHRFPYPQQLIDLIIKAHTESGGLTDLVLDVGCGPGIASRQVAPHFQHAIGADPGSSMIENARSKPSTTASGEPITFEVCGAEDLDRIAKPESVDLITAATSAHWFDLPKFYLAADRVLKPGGSIILWTSGRSYFDPVITPNFAEVYKRQMEWEKEVIIPFELPGNKHARELYANLPMPWTIEAEDATTKNALAEYDEGSSSRTTFNDEGIKDARFESGYLQYITGPLPRLKMMMSTASPITRWREAHKEKLEKGEIEDCVDYAFRISKEAMEEVPEGHGIEEISFVMSMVMIVIKKKSKPE